MFLFRGPYPAVSTTVILPSPEYGDSQGLRSSLTTLRAIDGTVYTYVRKRQGYRTFKWDFEISRNKALELEAFMKAFMDSKIQAVDHDDNTWVGYIKNNPFEFSGAGRAYPWPGNESMTISVQFEEEP